MRLSDAHRSQLFAVARQSIELGLSELRWVAMPPTDLPAPLTERRASFVTLRIHGQLRGCCGNLMATRTMGEDVWRNAWASAFADPRFSPLEADEWVDADLHISILSPLEPVIVSSEEQLLEMLRPRVDGLVLERDESRATFLPDVWEQLPDPRDFLYHLKQKAGWPATSWSPHIKVQRYTTESFGERESEELVEIASRRA
ncbi:MAG TPA: AmmeMemoRadiSam system protein A [Steroidobacteraceae bacterium]|nr:AmmeMemoRadiSam system protein A [Steroidobacteraceae bacterium]